MLRTRSTSDRDSGTASLGFTLVDGIMIEPIIPAIQTGLSLFLLSPLFLFFALFATVAHGSSCS
jgi:hypothetical protein